MEKKQPSSFWTDIGKCARCGKDHEHLLFVPVLCPAKEWTHWASCPVTSEPILKKIVEEPEFSYIFHL